MVGGIKKYKDFYYIC